MPPAPQPHRFWILWLLATCALVVLFGLILVLAPAFTRQGFSLLLYASTDRLEQFGSESVRHVSLTHAVIGSVLVGWGTALFLVTKTLLAAGDRRGWTIVAGSVAAWFLPDTAYSLHSGFWQNARLNAVFLALFAVPLWATRGLAR